MVPATILACIGASFTYRAVAMQFRRDYLWSQGFGVFTTDGSNSGMPIDAYVGWMHTFSAPFYVLALFVLYRLSRRFPVDRDDQAGAGRP